MSRYVDLDGKTWDGTKISSKIQEVKTKSGYMQGITVGWLWGDNVPKLDLEEHDKQIYNQALEDISEKIKWQYKNFKSMPSIQLFLEIVEQLKQ